METFVEGFIFSRCCYTFIFCFLDFDECSASSNNCSDNANCVNTIGNYFCTCQFGFSGDGYTCEISTVIFMFILKKLLSKNAKQMGFRSSSADSKY